MLVYRQGQTKTWCQRRRWRVFKPRSKYTVGKLASKFFLILNHLHVYFFNCLTLSAIFRPVYDIFADTDGVSRMKQDERETLSCTQRTNVKPGAEFEDCCDAVLVKFEVWPVWMDSHPPKPDTYLPKRVGFIRVSPSWGLFFLFKALFLGFL